MSRQFGGGRIGNISTGIVATTVLKKSLCPTATVKVGLPGSG